MRAIGLVGVLVTMGCGSAAGLDDAGGDSSIDLPVPIDQAAADSAQSDAASPDDAGALTFYKLGIINVSSSTGGASVNTSVSASFADFTGVGSCRRSEIGPCEINDCTGMGAAEIDSGTLTFGGGTTSEVLTHVTGGYNYLNIPSIVWAAGDTVSVSAAGAVIPAWSSSVVMPNVVTITAPVLSGSPKWPRGSDLTFTWQGGTRTVSITIAAPASGLRCDFPAGALAGTIPGVALSTLAPGQYSVVGRTIDRKVVSVSDWLISVVAYTNMTPGYSGNVTLQ